jgi:hypothetical protein
VAGILCEKPDEVEDLGLYGDNFPAAPQFSGVKIKLVIRKADFPLVRHGPSNPNQQKYPMHPTKMDRFWRVSEGRLQAATPCHG